MAHKSRLLVQLMTTVLITGIFVRTAEMMEVSVKPGGCICPDEGYSCEVALAGEITWMTESNLTFDYSLTDLDNEELQEMGGFKVHFSGVLATTTQENYTSDLFVTSLDVNGTELTCTGSILNRQTGQHELSSDTIVICLSAPASPPTGLSVVWDPPSAVVSFQSPVYGGECVDYYVVAAVSGEENITCGTTSDIFMFNCTIPSDRSVYDFNFTAYSVTIDIDGGLRNGGVSTDCHLPSPYNVSVYEEECGLKYRIKWKGSPGFPVTTSIAVNNTNYETMLTDENSHLLTLDYSETGPVEISVTFSSHLCNKTTVIIYLVEGMLTSVYLRSRTLVIESRNCIADLQNYSIIITTPTTMMNVSFNTTVEYDLEDVRPGTTVTVQLVETTSSTIIDERNYTIPYPTPTRTPTVTPTEPGAKQERGSKKVIPIAAGVGGGIVAVLLVVVVSLALLVWVVRNRRSKHVAINVKGEELKILGSPQVSVEEEKRSCDPPQTPAPAVPDSVSRPDVVPSLYAELDTLSRQKKEEPTVMPMYHVLEGPTPVETTPDTQESETSATDAPVYAMVDKSKKKKKNKGSESSATATPPASDIPVYSIVDKSKKKKNRGSKSSTTITEKEEEEEKEGEKEGEEKEEVTSI